MKMTKVSPALVLALAVVSTPAFAQSEGEGKATHFDGPYVSGVVGLGLQNNDGGDHLVFDTDGDGKYDNAVNTAAGDSAFAGFCNGGSRGATAADGCRNDRDKIEYGARLGYDKRLNGGNFVVGGLVEASRSNSTDSTSGFTAAGDAYRLQRGVDYAVSLRARAGYTPGGGALFYVTGGGGLARLDHKFATTNELNSFAEARDKKTVWGWQAGGGTEVMVTDNISVGLEYLYNRYKDNKYRVDVGPGTATADNAFLLTSGATSIRPSDKNFDYHSVRATVGLQF